MRWLAAIIVMAAAAHAAMPPPITVVYPKAGQTIGAVDSTFIFGHLPDNLPVDADRCLVLINNLPVPVHKEGGFLAFVPIQPGEFTFDLAAYDLDDTIRAVPLAVGSLTVNVPQPTVSVPLDSLAIAGDFRPPTGDRVLAAGEELRFSFLGTPGLKAWAEIPGAIDSIPMAETPPQTQAYWGEAVFGTGAIPDSLLLHGIYSGSVRIPPDVSVIDSAIVYHLVPPDSFDLVLALWNGRLSDSLLARFAALGNAPLAGRSMYRVSLNDPNFPMSIIFTDTVQITRYGPRLGYFAIFQPEGIITMAVGAEGDWYRIQLSDYQFAWAAKASVEPLPHGFSPPISQLIIIRSYSFDDHVLVEFPLKGKHPYRVIEDDPHTLRLQLFGVISNTDWIRYDFADTLISLATWSQPESGLYELKIVTTQSIWGYDVYYEGNRLYLRLNRPPTDRTSLRGKTIVVDPGHSADPGAIGPTGYTEAEANLGIALELARRLERDGATVVMTRHDDANVELYERPAIAADVDADLFVSVHNNALPDGVNPFVNHGTSTYYYHPHSIELARAVHREMIEYTRLPDHGLFHGNLAVNRPTAYPAILVECAFMMIPEQEARLKRPGFRKRAARAIERGIVNFLRQYE